MTAPNSDRNMQICARARLGESHEAIAEAFGISRQRVSQIVKNNTHGTAGEAQRAELAASYRRKYNELQRIIDHPPAKTTAIGKTVTDPDTGAIVRDQQVVVSAIRQQIAIGNEFRKMFAADINAPTAASINVDARVQVLINEIGQAQKTTGRIPPPQLQLPPGTIPGPEDITRAFSQATTPADGSVFVPPGVLARGPDAIWSYVSSQMYYKKLRGDEPELVEGVIVDD